MLNPRLKTFYEKIICEDFVVLYNFTNIARLPKLEHAILSSTSNNYGSSKISVLQSFCGWRVITSQKSITTRARKSIALFNIRKDALLGLKTTLRKKILFTLFDKLLVFVLPKMITSKSNYVLPSSFVMVPKQEKHNTIFFKSLLEFRNVYSIASCSGNQLKSIQLALPSFLKNEQVFNTVNKNDKLQLSKKISTTFLNKLFRNWQKQKNEKFFIDFSLPDRFSEKIAKLDSCETLKKIKEKKYFFILKKFNIKKNSKIKSFFTISNNSALTFPEISSLSPLFDSFSGFSLTFCLKNSNSLHNFTTKREDLIITQLLSAFGYLKN